MHDAGDRAENAPDLQDGLPAMPHRLRGHIAAMVDKVSLPPEQGSGKEEKRVEMVDLQPSPRDGIGTALMVLALTLFIHAGLFYVVPERLFVSEASQWKGNHEAPMRMIRLVPPKEAPIPEEQQYVQSTDAPSNKPDETPNYSDKDQQLSQKMESKDKTGDTPEVENAEEENTNALTTGQDARQATMEDIAQSIQGNMDVEQPSDNDTDNPVPQQQTPEQEAMRAEEQALMQPQKEQPTPPAPLAIMEESPQSDGEGFAEITKPGTAKEMPEKKPEEKEIPAYAQTPFVHMEQPKTDPTQASGAQPRPRPRLTLPGALPTVVRKTASGLATPNGFVAFDSKMSAFGDYQARMMEVIVTKWYELNRAGQVVVTDSRVFVRVSFFVTKDGQIEDFSIDESNASQLAQWRVKDAVLSNVPYFAWTHDMVDLLGDREQVRIQFIYR